MAVAAVGFDVGNQSCYIGAAKGGGIEVLANEYSDRCTPTFVSFVEQSRLFGAAAKQQQVTNMRNTLTGFTRLIGKKFSDPLVQKEIQFLPNTVVETADGGVGIEVDYLGGKQVFNAEQILAMILTKLKEISEHNLQTKVVDCVLSVPYFLTDMERRAFKDAAQIAGLNCVKLMNATIATALAYGFYKQDLPEADKPPRIVVFVDMGSCNLQASVVAFNQGKMQVKGTVYDQNLGGRDFDKLIYDHIVEDLKKRYKIDPNTQPKAAVRLLQECEKLKKLMSATLNDVPINIECFMNDLDITAHMKREEFEGLITPLLQRTSLLLEKLVKDTPINLEEIFSVEIVGGNTRIPAIKNLVNQIFNKEPSTTLNADEAVARGCALQCAMFSPAFKVREFKIIDAQPYAIKFVWTDTTCEPPAEKDSEIFEKGNKIPSAKLFSLSHKEPFVLKAVYSDPDTVPHLIKDIGQFKINGLEPTAEGKATEIKMKVRLNFHGLFNVSQVYWEEKYEVPVEPEPVVTKKEEPSEVPAKPVETEGAAKMDEDVPPAQTAPPSNPEKMELENSVGATETPAAATQPGPTETAPNENVEVNTKPKTIKKSKKIDLPFEQTIHQMSKTSLDSFTENEAKMIMQDKLEKERTQAKNNVEEYVYDMREKLYNQLEQFVSEKERDDFGSQLSQAEEWLYGEGENVQKQFYIDKLQELKKIGTKFEVRYTESIERPIALEEFGRTLQHLIKAISSYDAGEDLYSHIESAEMDKVKKCVAEKQQWFNIQMNLQTAKKNTEDPVLTANILRTQKQGLDIVCNPILNTPKPKPPAVETQENSNVNTEVNGEKGDAGNKNVKSPNKGASTVDNNCDGQKVDGPGEDMDLD